MNGLVEILQQMSDKEEEFPFEEFVQSLQVEGDLRGALRVVLDAVCEKNIYWVYSSISTLLEMLRSKDEEPRIKCRALEACFLLLDTCEYPVFTFFEVYLAPLLFEVAAFRGRKSEELASYYFQQQMNVADSADTKVYSLQFVERAAELLYFAARAKPFRTVETEELKQESQFGRLVGLLKEKGVEEPKVYKWSGGRVKDVRKRFLDNLRRFSEQSESWAEFLLVNLLQQVRTGKKELLQLRLLLGYGQSYLTSPVINVCEDELMQMTQNLDLKKKYLNLLNQLVRSGDIEAIIMIKNSEFVPAIAAHFSKVQGHLGLAQGDAIYPQIQAPKALKREFYSDFLRCLQTWAKTMPPDYDSEQFSLKSIYEFLKEQKKFKFPQNLHIGRYEKEIKQNLDRNKERNDKLVEILENSPSSRYQSLDKTPYSRTSNVLPSHGHMKVGELEKKMEEARRALGRLLLDQPTAEQAMKILTQFKDSWINDLQALDFENTDEAHMQTVITSGEKCVEQIQLVIPLNLALTKGKITYKQFKDRVKESLQFHNDVSGNKSNAISAKKSASISQSVLRSKMAGSKMGVSQFGKSKIAGRELLEKMKSKSKIAMENSKMDMSKAMDRSGMAERSRFTDRSKSKVVDNSRVDRNKLPTTLRSEHETPKLNDPQPKSHVSKMQEALHDDPSVNITKSINQYSQSQQSIRDDVKTSTKYKKDTDAKQTTAKNNTSKREVSNWDQRNKESDDEDDRKIMRIADYEVDGDTPTKPKEKEMRDSREKSKGSRLLARRSLNRSKLEKSGDSRVSEDRKSVGSNRSKQGSILKRRNHLQLNKTKKISEIESQLMKDEKGGQINETIEVNGNVVSQRKNPSVRKPVQQPQVEQIDNKFKDGVDEISSIHSNSELRIFHHSAEKILNITGKDKSQVNINSNNNNKNISEHSRSLAKNGVREVANNKGKEEPAPPLVGDNYKQEQSEDVINGPDLNPMRHSFHKQSGIKSKLGENPLFKAVFANKYEALQSREKDERLLRKQQGLKNIIKATKRDDKEKRESIAVKLSSVDRKLESQRTIKESKASRNQFPYGSSKAIDIVALESQKNRQIASLREKIRELEKETMTMKTKLAAKDNELRSIKSGSHNGSERGYAQFTSPSLSNYQLASDGKQKSEKNSLRGSSVGKKGELTKFQKEIQTGFKQYLQKIKGSSFCKSLFKFKCLVHKTEEIQVGCLSQRGQKVVECTLYVTPHRYDLLDFAVTIIHDNNIKIKTVPQQLKSITLKKQQKIHLTIEVLRLPFCLPQLQINHRANSEYSPNYYRFTLPLAFNKFCDIKPMQPEGSSQRHILYIRTDDFKLNGKVVKFDKLPDSFPNFTYVPGTKDRIQALFAANCTYWDSKFNLLLSLHEKCSWIEGFLLQGDEKPMNFLICTFKEMLNAAKK